MAYNLPSYEQVAQVLNAVQNIDFSAIGAPGTQASNVPNSNAHAKLNWLISNLESAVGNELANIDSLVDQIISYLGGPNSAASDSTTSSLHAKLNFLLSKPSATVKSVQRGVVVGNTTINLSPINPSKSLALVAGGGTAGSTDSYPIPYPAILTENSLRIDGARTPGELYSHAYSWQVIEFY